MDHPFLIAEAGAVHQGDGAMALQLAHAAVAAGADALTFQEIDETRLYSDVDDFPVPRQHRVGWDCLVECRTIARNAGLAFSVCVTDIGSLDKALSIGIDFIKIVSYDITFLPFLEYCGKTGLPILMSTGASTFAEVEKALAVLNAPGRVLLYHTDCGYPTKDHEVNLRRMVNLKQTFNTPVGYCDHTDHGLSCLAAAALGANAIEKHFTISRSLGGPDNTVSLEPGEIKELFDQIKRISSMLGQGLDRIEEGDLFRRNNLRRSVALNKNVRAGSELTLNDLTMLRPPIGLSWEDAGQIVGKKAARDLHQRDIVKISDVE